MAVAKIIAGADPEIMVKMDINMELFQFPAGGDGARNISEWLDMSAVNWDMMMMEGDQEKILTPEQREEKGVHGVKLALRATLISDCKQAVVYVSVIPVGARDVRAKIATWGTEISENSEAIPSVPLAVRGREEDKSKYSMTLPVGPLERPGDNMNMGWLPMLDFGEPEGAGDARYNTSVQILGGGKCVRPDQEAPGGNFSNLGMA